MRPIQDAVSELPEAHLRLWQSALTAIRQTVGLALLEGHVTSEVLVLVAHAQTQLGIVIATSLEHEAASDSPDALFVATLVGDHRRAFLRNLPSAAVYATQVPRDSFMVVLAPEGVAPGAVISKALVRSRLN